MKSITIYKSLKVTQKTKTKLDKLKVHPRESYEQVILRLTKLKGGKK